MYPGQAESSQKNGGVNLSCLKMNPVDLHVRVIYPGFLAISMIFEQLVKMIPLMDQETFPLK